MNAETLSADQNDDPILFKALSQRPKLAWPTVILFVAAVTIFAASTYAYLVGALPLAWVILINSIAAYMSFTVVHEASHNIISSNRKLNDWLGRAGTAMLSPVPFFRTFRFIHMQHHRFTNDPEKDPDLYAGTGPAWLLPFKWATVDFKYFHYYLNPKIFMQRPQSERRELYLAVLFGVAVLAVVLAMGWMEYYLWLYLLPTRIANLFLIFGFDFLPHYPHQAKAKDQPFQCTSNRVGMEWLMTPLFLYQNYHLVHHLYPTVPFYRNIKIWKAKQQYHESQNPAVTNAFSLKPRM